MISELTHVLPLSFSLTFKWRFYLAGSSQFRHQSRELHTCQKDTRRKCSELESNSSAGSSVSCWAYHCSSPALFHWSRVLYDYRTLTTRKLNDRQQCSLTSFPRFCTAVSGAVHKLPNFLNLHTFALQGDSCLGKNTFYFSNTTFSVFLRAVGCFNNGNLGEDKELTLVLFLSAFSSAISSSLSSSCSLHTFSSFVSAANSWNKPDRNISTSNIGIQWEKIHMNTWHDFLK